MKLYPRAFFVAGAQAYAITILSVTIALGLSAHVLSRRRRRKFEGA